MDSAIQFGAIINKKQQLIDENIPNYRKKKEIKKKLQDKKFSTFPRGDGSKDLQNLQKEFESFDLEVITDIYEKYAESDINIAREKLNEMCSDPITPKKEFRLTKEALDSLPNNEIYFSPQKSGSDHIDSDKIDGEDFDPLNRAYDFDVIMLQLAYILEEAENNYELKHDDLDEIRTMCEENLIDIVLENEYENDEQWLCIDVLMITLF